MNTYYLRCTEDLRGRLIELGVQLGAIAVVTDPDVRPAQAAPRGRSAGPVPAPTTRIQALHGGAWDEIGTILDDSTGTDVPDPLRPGQTTRINKQPRQEGGKRLWHANLRTPINLRARALEMAKSDPSIAAELAQLRRYFVTRPDKLDAAAAPQSPARVFA